MTAIICHTCNSNAIRFSSPATPPLCCSILSDACVQVVVKDSRLHLRPLVQSLKLDESSNAKLPMGPRAGARLLLVTDNDDRDTERSTNQILQLLQCRGCRKKKKLI